MSTESLEDSQPTLLTTNLSVELSALGLLVLSPIVTSIALMDNMEERPVAKILATFVANGMELTTNLTMFLNS
jgi:hypothetical protein